MPNKKSGGKKHSSASIQRKLRHTIVPNDALRKEQLKSSIESELIKANNDGVNFAVTAMKIFTYCVLGDKFGFEHDDIEKLAKEYNSIGDIINGDYATIGDFLKILSNEYKIKFTTEELVSIDPDLAGSEFSKI